MDQAGWIRVGMLIGAFAVAALLILKPRLFRYRRPQDSSRVPSQSILVWPGERSHNHDPGSGGFSDGGFSDGGGNGGGATDVMAPPASTLKREGRSCVSFKERRQTWISSSCR